MLDEDSLAIVMSVSGKVGHTELLKETEFKDYAPMISSLGAPFSQTLNNEEYILSQYDIVSDKNKSKMPSSSGGNPQRMRLKVLMVIKVLKFLKVIKVKDKYGKAELSF